MIAAIMQPYFFPYIGYFQLMSAVDTFVFFDDVQYINRGWVNRNRIRVGGRAKWLTFPVHRAGRDLPINRRRYLADAGIVTGIKEQLRASYAKSTAYVEATGLIHDLLDFQDDNVAGFNANLLERIARAIGIECKFVFSSQIDKPDGLKGQDKILDLCRRLGVTHYLNAAGGCSLYEVAEFESAGIQLSFLKTRVLPVNLQDEAQHLSIIDTLSVVGIEQTNSMLGDYDLGMPSQSGASHD